MTEIEAITWGKDMADHYSLQEETQELAEAMYMCAEAMEYKIKYSPEETAKDIVNSYYERLCDGCDAMVQKFQEWICLNTEPNRVMFYYTDVLRKLKQIKSKIEYKFDGDFK